MPFADKFRAMMEMPFPGEALGELVVESVEVGHEGRAAGHYAYPLRLVLRGRGGVAAVKRAIKPLFARRCTTFSGYGTPYQLWFGKPEIENLGQERYAVTGEGAGVRVHLEADLARFCAHLAAQGQFVAMPEEQAGLITAYLTEYQAEIQRQVGRYRTRIRRAERG